MESRIELKQCEEYLSCELTDGELIERSKQLAKANEDLADVEARKKDVVADFTAQQKRHEANIGVLSRVVSTGKEYRTVKCEWEINWTRGIKRLIRLDTQVIVKEAEIDQKERQVQAELQQKEAQDGEVSDESRHSVGVVGESEL